MKSFHGVKNTTYIKLDTLGTNSVEGWLIKNGQPKLHKYVVVEAYEAQAEPILIATAWLLKQGVRMAQVLIVPRPVEDATAIPA